MKLGKQYTQDDDFKRLARKYQSLYRAEILKVDYHEYGNRLNKSDAWDRNLNYFQNLNVIEELRKRYPNYSSLRDADMLRSEHISFNFFAPLKLEIDTAIKFFNRILNDKFKAINRIKFEYAPKPRQDYLNDDLTVFPNPTTGKIKLVSNSSFISRIEVFNSIGEVIQIHSINSTSYELDLEGTSGIYMLKVNYGDKQKNIRLIKN
jgi:hypothetical protein